MLNIFHHFQIDRVDSPFHIRVQIFSLTLEQGGVRRWLMLDNLLRDIWIWKSLSTRGITTWRQVEKWEGDAAYITRSENMVGRKIFMRGLRWIQPLQLDMYLAEKVTACVWYFRWTSLQSLSWPWRGFDGETEAETNSNYVHFGTVEGIGKGFPGDSLSWYLHERRNCHENWFNRS